MNPPRISDEVRIYAELKAKLLELEPDLDEQTLLDTLEGETDLQDALVSLAERALWAEAHAVAVHARMQDMLARQRRFERQAERLRWIVLWAMQEAGLKKILAPQMTLSVGAGRERVMISDIDALPMMYVEYAPKPLNAEIKAALKAGDEVPGAQLSNSPPILTIRTK